MRYEGSWSAERAESGQESASGNRLLSWLGKEEEDVPVCERLRPLVDHLLASLQDGEAEVLRRLYGLDDGVGRDVTGVAEELSLDPIEVCSKEAAALEKLYQHIVFSDLNASRN